MSSFRPSESLDTVLSGSQAVEDLDYIIRCLEERHPACMKGLPGGVELEYQQEREKIASAPEVTVLSLWQSAARVFSSLGDAHTSIGVNLADAPRLPFTFAWKNGTLICSGGAYDGYTVVETGGVEVGKLYEKFLTQFSYELEAWAQPPLPHG